MFESTINPPKYRLEHVRFDFERGLWCCVDPQDWTKKLNHFACGRLYLVDFQTRNDMGAAFGWLEERAELPSPLSYRNGHFLDMEGNQVNKAYSLLLMPNRQSYYEEKPHPGSPTLPVNPGPGLVA